MSAKTALHFTKKASLTLQSLRFSIFIQTLLSASELPLLHTHSVLCISAAHRIGGEKIHRSRALPSVGKYTPPRKKKHNIFIPKTQTASGFSKKGMCAWRTSQNHQLIKNYLITLITTPEPTVLPPSRIAKRRPFSIAIGAMSSTFMSTLSPGLHISTPSGRVMIPVTSVVLK